MAEIAGVSDNLQLVERKECKHKHYEKISEPLAQIFFINQISIRNLATVVSFSPLRKSEHFG